MWLSKPIIYVKIIVIVKLIHTMQDSPRRKY